MDWYSSYFSRYGQPLASERDFNVITHDGELNGHNTHDLGTTTFSDILLDCSLKDDGFLGNRHTWTNGRVRKRLDRVLINSTVISFCQHLIVRHLNRTSSNHSLFISVSFC